MQEKDIRKYAGLMKELGLTGLEIGENGRSVRLERHEPRPAAPVTVPQGAPDYAQGQVPAQDAGIHEVCSPMIGVFYAAPAENGPPYVTPGQRVKKGDIICIIESMKLMNEIVSDCDGIIEDICVENNQVVDFDHVLFRIRKER